MGQKPSDVRICANCRWWGNDEHCDRRVVVSSTVRFAKPCGHQVSRGLVITAGQDICHEHELRISSDKRAEPEETPEISSALDAEYGPLSGATHDR